MPLQSSNSNSLVELESTSENKKAIRIHINRKTILSGIELRNDPLTLCTLLAADFIGTLTLSWLGGLKLGYIRREFRIPADDATAGSGSCILSCISAL